jgi:hypothetical protein
MAFDFPGNMLHWFDQALRYNLIADPDDDRIAADEIKKFSDRRGEAWGMVSLARLPNYLIAVESAQPLTDNAQVFSRLVHPFRIPTSNIPKGTCRKPTTQRTKNCL